MTIVADTNIIIRLLIKPDGFVANLFYRLKNQEEIYLSSESLEEISEHKKRILKTSGLSQLDFDLLLANVISGVSIIPIDMIPTPFFISAYNYLGDVDIDDIPFLASSLFMEGYLWTSDKVLYKKLKAKGYNNLLNNEDVSTLLIEHK